MDDTLSDDALRANQARVSERETALQVEIQSLQSTQLVFQESALLRL